MRDFMGARLLDAFRAKWITKPLECQPCMVFVIVCGTVYIYDGCVSQVAFLCGQLLHNSQPTRGRKGNEGRETVLCESCQSVGFTNKLRTTYGDGEVSSNRTLVGVD
jgi:hypothetical protein